MNTATRMPAATALPPPLREEIGEALERLSQVLVRERAGAGQGNGADGVTASLEEIQDGIRFLGQVASGWEHLPEDALPDDGAGFGSTVTVTDEDNGGTETYTLMTGALLDIDAGQVSLASPIGRALLGTSAGDVVTVETPQRTRHLRVLSVCTLRDRLQQGV